MKALTIKFLFPLAVLVAVVLDCNWSKSSEAADSAVECFHKSFNESQYDKIYDAGASEFKDAITEDDWVKLLTSVKKKLGKVVDSKRTTGNIHSDLTAGTTVTMVYEVQFEEAKGKEQFIFRTDGDDAKLLRWDVTSPAFSLIDESADGQKEN